MPLAEDVIVSGETHCMDLSDGQSISVPRAWYPRLLRANPAERKRWRLIGRGLGIHWVSKVLDLEVSARAAARIETAAVWWAEYRPGTLRS